MCRAPSPTDGLAEIHARVAPEQRIAVAPEDAARLAANAVCLGDAIVLSRCSDELRERLSERGYRVIETPLALLRAQRRLGLLPDPAARPALAPARARSMARRIEAQHLPATAP